jgi:predicted ATP-grasp superfamily ATP-dependent carboligase
MLKFRQSFEHAFEAGYEAGYLRSFRKSDCQVISEMFVRDIKLMRILPREQQLKLAEMMRKAIDEIQGSVVDISD